MKNPCFAFDLFLLFLYGATVAYLYLERRRKR